MLKIEGLTKTYETRTESIPVLHGISLQVKKGDVFGFLGLNGAGKSTTIKIIVDLLFADSGQIKVGSLDHRRIEAKRQIGFMPEQPQFYRHLTATEVLLFVGDLFGLEKTASAKRALVLLEKVGLQASKDLAVRKFSKGMHQRLAFAVALLNKPQLLVMDEPLDGLDPVGRLDFKRLILEQKKAGTTVFFSSHILSDIAEICDELAIIDQGRVIVQGSPKQLAKNSASLETYFVNLVKPHASI